MSWSNTPQYHNSSSNYNYNYERDDYTYSSPNSVDCTLSLATPSTRLITSQNDDNNNYENSQSVNDSNYNKAPITSRNIVSSFCWDLLHSGKHSSKPNRRHSNSGDSRQCANCDTTSTPLWRNGPRGPKSLCNACGIRYKKEERRAAAAAASAGCGTQHETPQKMQNSNEFRFMDDDRSSGEGNVPFLSWLAYDRPTGLVHDYSL